MAVAIVIIGLLALAVFSRGFRLTLFSLVGVAVLALGIYYLSMRADDARQVEQTRVARQQVQPTDVALDDITIFGSWVNGSLRNNSGYIVDRVGIRLTLHDCPPRDPVC